MWPDSCAGLNYRELTSRPFWAVGSRIPTSCRAVRPKLTILIGYWDTNVVAAVEGVRPINYQESPVREEDDCASWAAWEEDHVVTMARWRTRLGNIFCIKQCYLPTLRPQTMLLMWMSHTPGCFLCYPCLSAYCALVKPDLYSC